MTVSSIFEVRGWVNVAYPILTIRSFNSDLTGLRASQGCYATHKKPMISQLV